MPSGLFRAAHLALLLLASSVVALASLAALPQAPTVAAARKPRLAVLLVFDQMRGDYLARWRPLFAEGGFERLLRDGAWFQQCHYPYAGTFTGPGHSTIATGCLPETHGIIANEWYERGRGRVSCVASTRYVAIPSPGGREAREGSASPDRLLSPTFADALEKATAGRARVVSLSLKDRSAVLPAGRRPTACYWADKDGRFVTSTYYRWGPHRWVSAFNAGGSARRWLNRAWDRLRPDLDYSRWSGADDSTGEGRGFAQGRTFPHPFTTGPKGQPSWYYSALANSPFGNTWLLDLARQAVVAENLGGGDAPDFLSISFSSNDLVGHTWGPDSQEVLDTTLRSDLVVKELLSFLDERVGKGRYVVVLTADHGICPLPEASRARGIEARRIDLKKLLLDAEAHLDSLFPGKEGGASKWIESHQSGMLYLDRKRIRRRGVRQAEVEGALARWLVKQPGIHSAWTRKQLLGPAPQGDAIGRQVRSSFHPDRSGDVILVLKPYHLLGMPLTMTTHGAPHPYDTHVPLIVYGPGVKARIRPDRVSPEAAAAILARALGVPPPAHARVGVPGELFAAR
jgi:hypothetical protein